VPQEDLQLDLRIIASATAEELRRLNETAHALQTTLNRLISRESGLSSETITDIQSLDYLTQSLKALSLFWAEMSLQAPDRLKIGSDEAARNITLRELSDRLRGVLPAPHSTDVKLDTTELF